MILCYMPEGTDEIIKSYLKNIKLTNAQKKWINEMLIDTTFIPLHRIKYLYYNFGLVLETIEEFEDNICQIKNKDERYRRCEKYIKQRINILMWKLAGNGDVKIDYEYRILYFRDLILNWDEFGLYQNNKLIAYFNQDLDNIVKILEKR